MIGLHDTILIKMKNIENDAIVKEKIKLILISDKIRLCIALLYHHFVFDLFNITFWNSLLNEF